MPKKICIMELNKLKQDDYKMIPERFKNINPVVTKFFDDVSCYG